MGKLDGNRGKRVRSGYPAGWRLQRTRRDLGCCYRGPDEGKRVDMNLVKSRLLVDRAEALPGWNEWPWGADGETIRTGAGPEAEKGDVDLP